MAEGQDGSFGVAYPHGINFFDLILKVGAQFLWKIWPGSHGAIIDIVLGDSLVIDIIFLRRVDVIILRMQSAISAPIIIHHPSSSMEELVA